MLLPRRAEPALVLTVFIYHLHMENVRYYLELLVKIKQVTKRLVKLELSGWKGLDIQNHDSYFTRGYFIFTKYSCVSWVNVPHRSMLVVVGVFDMMFFSSCFLFAGPEYFLKI